MASTGAGESLSVIALISGGKDSFFSILHCQANGHRVVALANLYPSPGPVPEPVPDAVPVPDALPEAGPALRQAGHDGVPAPWRHDSPRSPMEPGDDGQANSDTNETDLNSFMYQTVGHQIIPLYAQATGLPLHRQPILGTAVHRGLSYAKPRHTPQGPAPAAIGSSMGSDPRPPPDVHASNEELDDETESLVPLLRAVLKAHPEANAVCTGAILSTYQRTRVESVALRLGLVPLSYLWQFTELPASISGSGTGTGTRSCHHQVTALADKLAEVNCDIGRRLRKKQQQAFVRDDPRLLRDMAAAGLEARIVKVASAGLDEDFLWENVASVAGVQRMERAMRRFGASGGRGSILGEGGEFETLVIDGPPSLFKSRIVIADEDRRVIREGGGCAWLRFPRADLMQKGELEETGDAPGRVLDVRAPELLDPRFEEMLRRLLASGVGDDERGLSAFVELSLRDDSASSSADLTSTGDSSDLTMSSDLPKCRAPPSSGPSPVQEWCFFGASGVRSPSVEEQTIRIVDQIHRQLDKHDLAATAITNSVVVLRRMSDFPAVNEQYASLFTEPNPPSRVTISCGDKLLPRGAALAVYLTVQTRLHPDERRGLHVQSRSYWAPANIGPYSQAIGFPLLPLSNPEPTAEDYDDDDEPPMQSHKSSSPLAVSIAGQIALIPATMSLPPPSTVDPVKLQITLALQHLWRVGTEMQVRWWTSAVAYFPASSNDETMQHHAQLAATAWKSAHLWPDLEKGDGTNEGSDDEDDTGPDVWDRKYNSQFMTYGGGDEEESFPLSLPNWGVLRGFDVDDEDAASLFENKSANIPFFFAAEVEELPREAGVEWHAHLGLAELPSGSVTLLPVCRSLFSAHGGRLLYLDLHHVAVESESAVFIQTVAVVRSPGRTGVSTRALRSVFSATNESLSKLLSLPSSVGARPKVTYTESLRLSDDTGIEEIGAFIPCRSLWDAQGRRLCAVSVFETRVMKAK